MSWIQDISLLVVGYGSKLCSYDTQCLVLLFPSIKALIERLNNENDNWTLTMQSTFLAILRENCANACKIVNHGTWMLESKLRLHRVLGTSLGVGVAPTSKSGCRSAV
jgi:hypothetical protein